MDIPRLFPRTSDIIYFNHASSSPLPMPARERMKTLIDELASGDMPWNFWSTELSEFRSQSAGLLGAQPGEIGFIPNTSTGLLIALYSIPWREDDNVVCLKDGFPANMVPWMHNLPQIGKRQIEIKGDRPLEDRILDAIDEHTRAVAIDWVDFFTGYRVDLKKVGDSATLEASFWSWMGYRAVVCLNSIFQRSTWTSLRPVRPSGCWAR